HAVHLQRGDRIRKVRIVSRELSVVNEVEQARRAVGEHECHEGIDTLHDCSIDMNLDLFSHDESPARGDEPLAPGAAVLRGFATARAEALLEGICLVTASAPFRHLVTPGGFTMSVAMTNCGEAGWVSDRTGYRYDRMDPESGRRWPAMPQAFVELA